MDEAGIEPGSVNLSQSWDDVSEGGPDFPVPRSSSLPDPAPVRDRDWLREDGALSSLVSAVGVSLTSKLVISTTNLKTDSGMDFWRIMMSSTGEGYTRRAR